MEARVCKLGVQVPYKEGLSLVLATRGETWRVRNLQCG